MTKSACRLRVKLVDAVICFVLLATQSFAVEFNDFIVSYWCGPPSGGIYDAQYAEVAECNFTHAMYPVNGGYPEQNKATLDACDMASNTFRAMAACSHILPVGSYEIAFGLHDKISRREIELPIAGGGLLVRTELVTFK